MVVVLDYGELGADSTFGEDSLGGSRKKSTTWCVHKDRRWLERVIFRKFQFAIIVTSLVIGFFGTFYAIVPN